MDDRPRIRRASHKPSRPRVDISPRPRIDAAGLRTRGAGVKTLDGLASGAPSPLFPGTVIRGVEKTSYRKHQYFDMPLNGVTMPSRGRQVWCLDVDPEQSSAGSPYYRDSFPINAHVHEDTLAAARKHAYDSPLPDPLKEPTALEFYVYFEEALRGSPIERTRIRSMILVYRVEEESIELIEPKEDNSGMDQGIFLRRQRITKPDGSAYRPEDFVVGSTVNILAREFHIVDVSDETRDYISKTLGVTLESTGEREYPSTYRHPKSTTTHNWSRPTKVYADAGFMENNDLGFYSRKPDAKARFMKYSGKVLRFECEWDDTHRLYGDNHKLQLLYYLEDDTAEIITLLDRNSGRDEDFRRLLARQHLPLQPPAENPATRAVDRRPSTAPSGGSPSSRSVCTDDTGSRLGFTESMDELAVAAERAHVDPIATRYHHVSPITGLPLYDADDSSRPSTAPKSRYRDGRPVTPIVHQAKLKYAEPAHLRCGTRLPVAGKWLLIRRCDRWTRDWYRKELSIYQEFPEAPLPDAGTPGGGPRLPPAPHAGITAIGTEMDSRRACESLVPKPARPDFEKFHTLDGKTLNFSAKLTVDSRVPDVTTTPGVFGLFTAEATRPTQVERRFIVRFHLSDDTVSILEIAEPNSGFVGGKFLDRGRYSKAFEPEVYPSVKPSSLLRTAAYLKESQRRFDNGSRFGYVVGVGQGYPGGGLARQDRVDAGAVGVGTGVGALGDVTRRLTNEPKYFSPEDFFVGAVIEFAHAPGQAFELIGADSSTREYLLSKGAPAGSADSDESVSLDQATQAPLLPGCDDYIRSPSMRRVAAHLQGCVESLSQQATRLDIPTTGSLPSDTIRALMARLGAAPPAVADADLDDVIAYYSNDVGMVNIARFTRALKGAINLTLGLPDRLARVSQQLRSALTSNITHMRKVFRDLDRDRLGAITPLEFHYMLRRHTLDAGLSASDIRLLMSQYPLAASDVEAPAGSISWRGFLETVVGADHLTPTELGTIIDLVAGVGAPLKGAGFAPACPDNRPLVSPIMKRVQSPSATLPATTAFSPVGEPEAFAITGDSIKPNTPPPSTDVAEAKVEEGEETESEFSAGEKSTTPKDETEIPSRSYLTQYEAGASAPAHRARWAEARATAAANHTWSEKPLGGDLGQRTSAFASESFLGRQATFDKARPSGLRAAVEDSGPSSASERVQEHVALSDRVDKLAETTVDDTAGDAAAEVPALEDKHGVMPAIRMAKEHVYGNSPRFGGRQHYTMWEFGEDGVDADLKDDSGRYPAPYKQPTLPTPSDKAHLLVEGHHVGPSGGSPERAGAGAGAGAGAEAAVAKRKGDAASAEDVAGVLTLVDRLRAFYKEHKYSLIHTFSVFDTYRHGRLTAAAFIAALHAAGFDMNRMDRDLLTSRLFPEGVGGAHTLDYTMFLDTLVETSKPESV